MSCENHRRIVSIPVIVEPVVVPVPLAIVPVQIEDIAVAVRAAENLYRMPPIPPPLEYSRGCTVFDIIMP